MSKPLTAIFHFFVFSNIFIACCAVVMVCQVYHLLIPDSAINIHYIGFVFFATLSSYSFHWYLTPATGSKDSSRIHWLNQHRNIHLVLFFIGTVGAIFFALFLYQHWFWLSGAAIATFLYSAPKIPHPWFRKLRKIAFGKTIFLAFTWMYVTTILPLQISNQSWKPAFYLFAGSRLFLIYAICILFDYRDRDYDKSIGIKSLITWLPDAAITRLFVMSLIFFFICTTLLLQYSISPLLIVALLIPGIVTGFLYTYAIKHRSDMLYYLILDGLMALSAIITLLNDL